MSLVECPMFPCTAEAGLFGLLGKAGMYTPITVHVRRGFYPELVYFIRLYIYRFKLYILQIKPTPPNGHPD